MGFNRLFIALTLPQDILYEFNCFRSDYPKLRWTVSENLHLTLRFIGWISEENTDAVRNCLKDISFKPFGLKIIGMGTFQGKGRGILWAGVEQEKALFDLKKNIDLALKEVCPDLKGENFSPHITLSRLKTGISQELRKMVLEQKNRIWGSISVTEFVLFRSLLAPSGPIYEIIEIYAA